MGKGIQRTPSQPQIRTSQNQVQVQPQKTTLPPTTTLKTPPTTQPVLPKDQMLVKQESKFSGSQQPSSLLESTSKQTQMQRAPTKGKTLNGGAIRPKGHQAVLTKTQQGTQATTLSNQFKTAGLSDNSANALQRDLAGMDTARFKTESAFLKTNVLGTPNASRAGDTYSRMQLYAGMPKMSNGQARVTDDMVHTLTRGVAESTTNGPRGQKGLIGRDQAINTGLALSRMSETDVGKLQGLLGQAGSESEKMLLLKSVGARSGALTGGPNTAGPAMQAIEQYAGEIRGKSRNELVQSFTVLDMHGTGTKGSNALQQRFSDSCGCTVGQMLRAESDPIYAKKFHQEAIHSTNANTDIGREQGQFLTSAGGNPVARNKNLLTQLVKGEGITDSRSGELYNRVVKPYTGTTYTSTDVTHTREGRQTAMDQISRKLQGGQDVPIGVKWSLPGGHTMLLSDMRGTGDDRQYLLTDPYKGKTKWLDHQNIVNGSETWGMGKAFGRGSLDNFWG